MADIILSGAASRRVFQAVSAVAIALALAGCSAGVRYTCGQAAQLTAGTPDPGAAVVGGVLYVGCLAREAVRPAPPVPAPAE